MAKNRLNFNNNDHYLLTYVHTHAWADKKHIVSSMHGNDKKYCYIITNDRHALLKNTKSYKQYKKTINLTYKVSYVAKDGCVFAVAASCDPLGWWAFHILTVLSQAVERYCI